MLDAKQVDTVVQELKREETRRTEADHFDPTRAPRARQMTVVNDFARLDQAPFSSE